MSDDTDEGLSNIEMRIWSCHRPPLQAGTYTIVVQQKIATRHEDEPSAAEQSERKEEPKEEIFVTDNIFTAASSFVVGGSHLTLAPADVHAMFPPAGSEGDYGHVLPHIVLSRSTLPWERSACPGGADSKSPPWLALLVLQESEFSGPTMVVLADLPAAVTRELTDEEKSKATPVNVIDVSRDVLRRIVPDGSELSLLTHVRGTGEIDEPGGKHLAVIVSKRLPRRDAVNFVHLVALDGRYQPGKDNSATMDIPDQPERVRLVCLRSWTFACKGSADSLVDRLDAIRQTASPLHLPPHDDGHVYTLSHARIADRTARAPHPFAWYRGPLTPGPLTPGPLTPVDESAPAPSYAVARELGRLLALQTPTIATGLMHWRSSYLQTVLASRDPPRHCSPLDEAATEPEPPPFSAETMQWLKGCTLLQGLPFHHLVPDDLMLPAESMRFFMIDDSWIEQLLAGALSLATARATVAVMIDMGNLLDTLRAMVPKQKKRSISGLLLRSQVVTGWPELSPIALDETGKRIELLSMLRPAPNVLLCLFDGVYASVRIHNPPAMLHFEIESIQEHIDGIDRYIDLKNDAGYASSASLAQDLLTKKYKPERAN